MNFLPHQRMQEAESTPVSVSVDTSKLEKAILAMSVKEEEVYW